MPEENFEQQARHKAERFSMEPKPGVWQRVQAAIAPEKRRRRVLLWWWLLPIGIAGALAVYVVTHHQASSPDKDSIALTKEVNAKKKESHTSGENKKENHIVILNGNHDLPKQNSKEENRKAANQLFEKNKKHGIITQQNEVAKNKNGEAKKDDKKNYFAELSGQKERVLVNHDSVRKTAPALLSNEVALPDDTVKIDTIATITVKDTVQRKLDTTIASDKKIDNKKKINNKSWQFGVLAEIGISSRGKSLFRFNNNESKSFDAAPTIPQNNTGGINSDSNISSRNMLVYQTIQPGVDAAVGGSVRKTLSHRFYISGQFSYRYQQYTVRNIVRDSVIINGAFSGAFSNLPAGDENYHLHFLNLFMGIGWQYFSGKKNTLSVETGIDNSLLITMKQSQQNQSSQFNNAVNNSFAIDNFYRWQPQAIIALPVAFNTGQIHLQLSPFGRFGLHSLQKNNSSYKDNHLVSAGIQAIYFFK